MTKAKTLFISSVVLATGFLAAALISGNYQIKSNEMLASLSSCPVIPPHQTNISVNPGAPEINQSVSIKTDDIPECPTSGIPTSCEWRWSGSVNRTTTNKPTGQFSTSFSSSGNKTIHVEVYSSMQGICGGELINVAYGDISFNVSGNPDPATCSLSANPASITSGNSSTLTWSSNNATNCSASWTSSTATSGTKSVSPTATKTYNMTCTGAGGSGSCSTTVTVTTNPGPTLSCSLSANPNSGSAPLNNVDLTATVSGSATGNINYYFDCKNDGSWEKTLTGQTAASKTAADLCDYASNGTYTAKVKVGREGLTDTCTTNITVSSDPNSATCSLSANPASITSGNSSTLTWSSNNATNCSASWTSSTATSGTKSVSPSSSTTYNMTCAGAGGSGSCSTTVTVSSGPTPTITPTPNPNLSCSISANPNSGSAPLNVDLTASVSGTLTGSINYYFDCDNDGSWEKTFSGESDVSKTAIDLCNYTSNGTYVAKAKVERGGFNNTCTTSISVGGGGGGDCSYWQEGCYPTPTPTITPTPTPTLPPIACSRAPFGPAIPETLCLVTVANGGTCVLTNNDGFTVRLNIPANAVAIDSIVDISIHNPTDYPQLSRTIGTSRLIGPKIVYIFAQDQNCQPITFLKDAIVTFVYPNSYSQGYLESSFIVENTLSANGFWNFLPSSGNTAANSLVGVTKNLGYFGIFGRLTPVILGTATASPTPSPVCPAWPTPTPTIIDRPTDAELIEAFFVASLIDSFKNLKISWCEFISFLNFLLILLLLWLALGKKWLNNSKEKDSAQLKTSVSTTPVVKRENWFKKFFGSIAASFAAFALVQKKAWKDYKAQNQERKLARQNGKSLSVASLIIPETISRDNSNPEAVQGPQFIAFTEDKN